MSRETPCLRLEFVNPVVPTFIPGRGGKICSSVALQRADRASRRAISTRGLGGLHRLGHHRDSAALLPGFLMCGNFGFEIKMLLIVVAGINAFVFHLIAYQSVSRWDNDPVAPFSARAAGLFSILLWFGIVAAGRWIAYG